MQKPFKDQILGCLLGGAIGDAFGSAFENQPLPKADTVVWGLPAPPAPWLISDDTQLAQITCNALLDPREFSPELLVEHFLSAFKKGRLRGLGSSTLQALRDLDAGISWMQSGRQGEHAAGNGAAMRIAPFAFCDWVNREWVWRIARITHRNDEACTGALAHFLALRHLLQNPNPSAFEWMMSVANQLPDTNLKDRLIFLSDQQRNFTLSSVTSLGVSGYVVDSVPFAFFAATQVHHLGFGQMLEQVVAAGGDTDTNASLAGQLAGFMLGASQLPIDWVNQFKSLEEGPETLSIFEEFAGKFGH